MTLGQTPDDERDVLTWLQGWYGSQCDGDWEHDERVLITTLDNPGWSVRVGLVHTPLETKPFEPVTIERNEHDWIHAWVDNTSFHSACGPANLGEAVALFRAWTSS